MEIITARCDVDGLANLLDGRRVEEDAPAPARGYLQKFRTDLCDIAVINDMLRRDSI